MDLQKNPTVYIYLDILDILFFQRKFFERYIPCICVLSFFAPSPNVIFTHKAIIIIK